jgi:arachidonate 15-lipoxygenase
VGQDGRVQTRDYLVDAVTLIIFTASAQHAAVNYPQSFIMSYAPAMPLAGYALAPSSARGADPRGLSLVVAFARRKNN